MLKRTAMLLMACLLVFGGRAAAEELPLLLREDFEKGADRWQATEEAAWSVVDSRQGKAYGLTRQSKYEPPHRSPVNYALVKELTLGDFVLEADVRSTVKDYAHRDMCLFFGFQDAAHFYYVHLGKAADDHANQIFIVNEAPRKKISTKTTTGTPWTDGWHHVKVVRDVEAGTIEVYFDDMETPAMTAQDKTFASGQVGLGTFDDTGEWDNVTIRGKQLK